MPKKYNYYNVNTSHFKVQTELCFGKEEFKSILADYGVFDKIEALECSLAETHYLSQGAASLIILVFDLEECDRNPATLAGLVAHEATHCVCRIFEHIGEDVEDIGEESRAYLTEHIVAQITQAIIQEKEKRARKTDRKLPKQKGQGAGGIELQVDQLSVGSPRPDSHIQGPAVVSGVENLNGSIIPTPTPRIC
jgi:hypothetical protein